MKGKFRQYCTMKFWDSIDTEKGPTLNEWFWHKMLKLARLTAPRPIRKE